LLNEDREVITLTNSWQRANPFQDKVKALPFNFDNPDKLVKSLEGAEVLYNTYWVRFNFSGRKVQFEHNTAVEKHPEIIQRRQGPRVSGVSSHVSIANPSEDSQLEYFSGKAKLEKALSNSGLSYAILRPLFCLARKTFSSTHSLDA
jgi:NADH dehydrogenase